MITLLPERPGDAAAIDALLDDVFGPGRFAKTAYRLREDQSPIAALSFVALEGEALIGSIRFSEVLVGDTPVLFLGPLVIKLEERGKGHGLALMKKGLEAAQALGAKAVLLVGDAPYYARAGFSVMPAGRLKPIGPIDPARLLGLALEPGALDDLQGSLRPLPAATPAR